MQLGMCALSALMASQILTSVAHTRSRCLRSKLSWYRPMSISEYLSIKLTLEGPIRFETDFFFVAAFEQELREELVLLLILFPPFFVEINANDFSFLAEDLVISYD